LLDGRAFAMEMFSMLKHHIVADGANPITQHFHLVRQVATAGQQHVWKIYDAKRIKDGKVYSFVAYFYRAAWNADAV